MKYYTSTTEFNCGIDLHARQMYVCVMDRQGKKLVHTNVKDNDFEFFLQRIEPYKHDLTVCCECMFGWYWLADACHQAGLTFVLAHALYLRAIHGGKNKNDRIDSEKLTHLLRCNLIPPSYVYPADKRPMRALLRQRVYYVWRRTEILNRIQSHQLAYNRRPVKCTTRQNRDPWEQKRAENRKETHPPASLEPPGSGIESRATGKRETNLKASDARPPRVRPIDFGRSAGKRKDAKAPRRKEPTQVPAASNRRHCDAHFPPTASSATPGQGT